jgi:hypothetical protein
MFCKCCGMRLRASPSAREYKIKVRAKKKLTAVAYIRYYVRIKNL